MLLQEHAKLITFFSQCKQIVGRKRLQKMIYILKKCNIPFTERYQFHFYGPYSEELTLQIEELVNLGFLNEDKEQKSSYYQYLYSLTEEGQNFLQHFNMEMPNMTEQIEKMNAVSSRFLELVSTMMYFDHLSKEEVEEKVLTVKKKQNFTEDELAQAWDFIRELKDMQS